MFQLLLQLTLIPAQSPLSDAAHDTMCMLCELSLCQMHAFHSLLFADIYEPLLYLCSELARMLLDANTARVDSGNYTGMQLTY